MNKKNETSKTKTLNLNMHLRGLLIVSAIGTFAAQNKIQAASFSLPKYNQRFCSTPVDQDGKLIESKKTTSKGKATDKKSEIELMFEKSIPIAEKLNQLSRLVIINTVKKSSPLETFTQFESEFKSHLLTSEKAIETAKSPSEFVISAIYISKILDQISAMSQIYSYLYPFQISKVSDLQTKYSFNVSKAVWSQVNAFFAPNGFDVLAENSNKKSVAFALSEPAARRLLTDAAARSEEIRAKDAAFFETSRCVVLQAMSERYLLQASVIHNDQNSYKLPVDPKSKACLNTDIADLQSSIVNSLSEIGEGEFRSELAKTIYTLTESVSKNDLEFILRFRLSPNDLALIYISPENGKLINKEIEEEDVKKIHNLLSVSFANAQKVAPYAQSFSGLTEMKEFANLLNQINKDCGLEISADDLKQYISGLQRGEQAKSLFLDEVLFRSVAPMSKMTPDDLLLTIKQNLVKKKYDDISLLVSEFLSYYLPKTDNKISQIGLEAPKILYAWAVAFVNQYTATKEFQNWVIQINRNREALLTRPDKLQAFRSHVFEKAYELSKQANLYKSSTTSPKELPYKPLLLAQTITSNINLLSPKNKARFEILAKQKSYNGYVQVWQVIKQKLDNEVKAYGVTCELANLATKAKDFYDTKVKTKSANGDDRITYSEKISARDNCAAFRKIALVMGLELTETPQSFEPVYSNLERNLNSDEFKTVVGLYRKYLAEDVLSGAKFLLQRNGQDQTNENSPQLFELVSQYQNAKEAEATIRNGIQNSQQLMAGQIQAAANFTNDEDFLKMSHKTTSLSTLLEEYPKLKQKHDAYQAHYERYLGLDEEISDENKMMYLLMTVGSAAPSIAKTFLPMLSQARFAKATVSLAAGLSYKLEPVTNLLLAGITPYFIFDIYDNARRISAYNNEKQLRADLFFADGLSPKGLNDNFIDTTLMPQREFNQQMAMYNHNIEVARTAIIRDAFILPIGWAAGTLFTKVIPQSRFGVLGQADRLKKFAGEPEKIAKVSNRIQKSVTSDLMRLGDRLSRLKIEGPITLQKLKSARDSIRVNGTANQISVAEADYLEIVATIGSRYEQVLLKNSPEYLKVFSRTVGGPKGTVDDLTLIYNEYVMVVRSTRGAR